jgi:hypothetical protein
MINSQLGIKFNRMSFTALWKSRRRKGRKWFGLQAQEAG